MVQDGVYKYKYTATSNTTRITYSIPDNFSDTENRFYLDDVKVYKHEHNMIASSGVKTRYRYGFNGMERDDNIKGAGNSYSFEYRVHDPRLGRFFSVDPFVSTYPHNSPYAYAENDVISSIDLEGLEKVDYKEYSKQMKQGVRMLKNAKWAGDYDHDESTDKQEKKKKGLYDADGVVGFSAPNTTANKFFKVINGRSFQIVDGVKPSDAIKHVYQHASKYALDCAFYSQFTKLIGLLRAMGPEAFDKYIKETGEKFTVRSHESTGLKFKQVWVNTGNSNEMMNGQGQKKNQGDVLSELPIGGEVTLEVPCKGTLQILL